MNKTFSSYSGNKKYIFLSRIVQIFMTIGVFFAISLLLGIVKLDFLFNPLQFPPSVLLITFVL